MTKYIQGKDGKMAGSIGDGKANTPSLIAPPATLSTRDIPPATPADFDDAYKRLQQLRNRSHDTFSAARTNITTVLLDKLPNATKIAYVNYAGAFDKPRLQATTAYDQDGNPIPLPTDDRDWTANLHAAVNQLGMRYDAFDRTDFPTITTNGQVQHYMRLPKACGIDGCTWDISGGGPGHHSFKPDHRPHCTCNGCY